MYTAATDGEIGGGTVGGERAVNKQQVGGKE